MADYPTKFEVCDRCGGRGQHTNPAIDGNGITQSEMEELGEDFREDYLAGVYNIPCEVCHGLRVVEVIDESRASMEQIEAYYRDVEDEAEMRAIEEMERRAGA